MRHRHRTVKRLPAAVHAGPMAAALFLLTLTGSIDAGSWSRWMRSDCSASLEYRVRHLRAAGGDRHQWSVDIRNRYRERALFHWTLVGQTVESPRANNQMELRAGGQVRRNAITAAGPRERVRFIARHLRLGTRDAPERACAVRWIVGRIFAPTGVGALALSWGMGWSLRSMSKFFPATPVSPVSPKGRYRESA